MSTVYSYGVTERINLIGPKETFVNLKNFWENRESLSSETKNFTRKFIQAIFLDFSIRFKCVCFFFATGSSVGIFFKWIPMHALSQKFYECNKI